MTKVEQRTDFEPTKDTPYSSFMGKLQAVYCEYFRASYGLSTVSILKQAIGYLLWVF